MDLPEKWTRKLARGEPVARTLACNARDGPGDGLPGSSSRACAPDGTVFRVTAVLRDQTDALEATPCASGERLAGARTTDVLWDWTWGQPAPSLYRWRDLLGLETTPTGSSSDWLDRVHPEDAAPLRAALTAHFEARTDTFEHEHRVRHADGDWRWILVRGTARRDEKGAAVRAAGLMSDISRHRTLVSGWHDAHRDELTGCPTAPSSSTCSATRSTGPGATRITGSRCSSSTSTASRW